MSTVSDVANFQINSSGVGSAVAQPQNINISLTGIAPNATLTAPEGFQVAVVGEQAVMPSLVVSESNPQIHNGGIWVQTGLGDDGNDFTFWIEDGK